MLSTRPDFSSEIDIRKARAPSTTPYIPSAASIGRNNIQHSISSSALRTSDYYHQVTYSPQSSVPITNLSGLQSAHPSSSYIPDSLSTSSLSNRPTTTTNINNIYASTTSLSSTASGGTMTIGKGLGTNNIPLTRKSIIAYSNRTFRVTFSDDSAMIIRQDSSDGQTFIDAQGKRYSFDRRQLHQPEAIQERLALFYQNEHDIVDYPISS